jgi:SET domain-containing protein
LDSNIPAEPWLSHKVEVRASPIHGLGLFARELIAAGEAVIVLGGQVISDEEMVASFARGERFDGIGLGDGRNLRIDSSHPAVRGNHSCDSNLWMADAVTLIARRDIAPGDEVTVDYALFTSDPSWRMEQPCRCGADCCRGTVRGDNWRLPDVQARYAGHFAPFLQERRLG